MKRLMRIESLARFPLAQLPTPIEELKSLSRELSVGRSCSSSATTRLALRLAASKTRKLEFLVGQARRARRGYAGHSGRGAIESLSPNRSGSSEGGFALRALLERHETRVAEMATCCSMNCSARAAIGFNLRSARPNCASFQINFAREVASHYVIPVGGSNGVGATGYVLAMIELVEQLGGINRRVDPRCIRFQLRGTQAGMVVGAKVTGFDGKLHGVSIDKGRP